MATKQQLDDGNKDFGNSFDETEAAPIERTDDDAFGLTPPVDETADFPSSPEEAMEAEADEPAPAAEAGPAALTPDDLARETQRLKSWEGRLKAREAELKAQGAGAGESEESGESPVQEAIEQEAAKVAGMDPDKALKMLADDFGEDFANMLVSIIDAKVAQASGAVSQSVDEIINDIVDSKARAHFETIADQHPDFMDVAESAEFKDYVASLPGEASATAQQTIETGSAREICKLLAAFKASQNPAKGQVDERLNDAEGVRSTGLRLPEAPTASSDYAKAWDEA
jgi:hypothetical protein